MIPLILLVALFLAPPQGAPAEEAAPRSSGPNVLVLLANDQGWNGTSVEMIPGNAASASDFYRTPNLERLAQGGMRFGRAYSAASNPSSSRAALLTGRSPARLGLTRAPGTKDSAPPHARALTTPSSTQTLDPGVPTVADALREAGYLTSHAGTWNLGDAPPAEYGFGDALVQPQPSKADMVADPKGVGEAAEHAARAIRAATAAGRPFYAQVWFHAVHGPAQTTPQSFGAQQKRKVGKRHNRRGIAAMTEDLDGAIGSLLDLLEELEIDDSTYVVYTSGNGALADFSTNAPLRSGKGELYEGGIRVPLIVRGPGIPAGGACVLPVVGTDLAPTIAGWAGASLPDPLDGGDLGATLLSGGTAPVQRALEGILVHFPHYATTRKREIRPATALVLGSEKLLRSYDEDRLELYDLSTDLREAKDLAGERPERTQELVALMTRHLEALGASVPTPREAR